MNTKTILTPYFLDTLITGLEALKDWDWTIIREKLPESTQMDRMSVLHSSLAKAVEEVCVEGAVPVSIAGDCCTTIPMLAGLRRAGIHPLLIWFDAHGDFNTWETSPSGFLGGMPLAMLVGKGEQTFLEGLHLDPMEEDRVILTDARDLDPDEKVLVDRSMLTHLQDPRELLDYTFSENPLWIHFDTDILDPEDVPAQNFPRPGRDTEGRLEKGISIPEKNRFDLWDLPFILGTGSAGSGAVQGCVPRTAGSFKTLIRGNMKPFQKNVALAVDGGGIKGVIASRAIAILEDHLQKPSYEVFKLLAGTSTGSIISAGIATGLFAEEIHQLYCDMGPVIFRDTWRSKFWPLTRYRYPLEPLEEALESQMGGKVMGDFWFTGQPIDLVITAFDLVENKTLFIKPFNLSRGYDQWPVVKAVLASSSVPSFFPPVEDRYVDGGVGSYHNPCYVAAYEAQFVLGWDPAETTLISLGTGREPHALRPDQIRDFYPWHWISPVLGAFRNPQMINKFTWSKPSFRSWISGDSRLIWMDPIPWMSLKRYRH